MILTPEMIISLMVLILLLGIFSGFPTGLVLGGVGMIFGVLFVGVDIFGYFILRLENLAKSYTLLPLPLFLFMGIFMERSGSAEKLFNAMYLWWGGIRGGLGISTVLIATIFAAATGVVGASVVVIGLMALPAMTKAKYNKELSCGLICAGGTLGILIPPSVMIIIYGPMAGISVGKLFMGALLPGLLLSAMFCLYIAIRCFLRPEDGPAITGDVAFNISWKKKVYLLATSILPPLILVAVVLGSIFTGIAAVTEAAAVGAIASILMAACYGRLTWNLVKEACLSTLHITSMVMLIAIGSSFFSAVFVELGGDEVICNILNIMPLGKWGVLASIMIILVILGMFIDWMGIIFILVPIITPIVASFGFDPLWFAVLVMVDLQISFLSPPFAYSVFYLKGIVPPEITTIDIYRGVVPFLFVQVFVVFLCVIFPEVIKFLPSLMKG